MSLGWRMIVAVIIAAGLNVAVIVLPALMLGRLSLDVRLVCFLLLATFFLLGDASSLWSAAKDEAAKTAEDRRQFRLAALTGVLLWGTFAAGVMENATASFVLLLIGAIMMLVGTALRYLAIRDLQSQFTSAAVVQTNQRHLVQSGIYRLLRHPSELGLLFAAGGAALLLHSIAAAIGACALLLTVAWRIRWEDEQLARAWPAEFSAYRRRVPALLPHFFPRP